MVMRVRCSLFGFFRICSPYLRKQRHKHFRGTETQQKRPFNILAQLEFTLPISFSLRKQEGDGESEKVSQSLRSECSCQVELCVTEHAHPIYGKGQRSEKAITG